MRDLVELKQRLVAVWADFEQTIVDKAIDQWRKRLRTCVKNKGQHFEQLLLLEMLALLRLMNCCKRINVPGATT